MAIIYPPSGGKIYGDTNVYPPSGGKIYPGTAYPSGLNPNWPFSDIPLPPFLWRPDLTGDYTNVGSDGAALNLANDPNNVGTPAGSFNNGWVISDPTGNESSVVGVPQSADVNSLGAIFSYVCKFKAYQVLITASTPQPDQSYGFIEFAYQGPGQPLAIAIVQNGLIGAPPGGTGNWLNKQGTILLEDGVEYTIVITFNAGDLHLYINGVEDTLIDVPATAPSMGTVTYCGDSGNGLFIGDDSEYPDGPAGDGSIVMVEAIAKGIAYSPAQVAEITAGLS